MQKLFKKKKQVSVLGSHQHLIPLLNQYINYFCKMLYLRCFWQSSEHGFPNVLYVRKIFQILLACF